MPSALTIVPLVLRLLVKSRAAALRFAAAAAVLAASLTTGATPALSDPAGPWATTSGACPANTLLQSPTLSTDKPAGLVRITSSSGALDTDSIIVGAGDIGWEGTNATSAGSKITLYLSCPSTSWTAGFYDVPGTPVSFSGRSSYPASGWYSEHSSELLVNVPARTPYLADVTMNQGSLELRGDGIVSTTIASSQTVDLGVISQGFKTFYVRALNGPPVTWTVNFRGVPVTVSAVKTTSEYTAPGAIQKIGYTLNGDTNITATISGPTGLVRTLATGLPQQLGSNELTWDSRGDGGAALPDGKYTIDVRSNDAHGGTTSAQGTITIDQAPPIVTTTSPTSNLKVTDAVTAAVTDTGSGVDKTLLALDGDPAPKPPTQPNDYYGDEWLTSKAPGSITAQPQGSWHLGKHILHVVAFDKAGNRTTKDIAFSVGNSSSTSNGGGSSSAPVRTWRQCGSRLVTGLRTRGGTSCKLAARIVRKLRMTSNNRGRSVSGYKCTRAGSTSSTFTCRKGTNRIVRWAVYGDY